MLDALTNAWRRLPAWPDAPAALTRLRERFLMAPVSNGNISMMAMLARFNGFHWDAILGAELADDYKPNAEVYLTACAAFDLAPQQCVMVAAHTNDLKAAAALGLRTAHVARPNERGPGKGEGKFNTPHGLWVDTRGAEPRIVVCDRAHNTLQFFDLNGKYQKTIKGFGLPANAEIYKGLLVIPELHARISILDKDDNVIARLGDDVARVTGKDGGAIRGDSKKWQNGKFVHPHDACFDADGNILVAEWVATGRISKLRKVS